MADEVLRFGSFAPMAEIAFWLGEQPKFGDMVTKLKILHKIIGIDYDKLYNPIFKNASLYNRSTKDFEYSVNIIFTVLDEKKLQGYFKDTGNISLSQLLDANGNVLEAGLGGPKNGFYGPCIWNVVESWGGENGENEIKNDD